MAGIKTSGPNIEQGRVHQVCQKVRNVPFEQTEELPQLSEVIIEVIPELSAQIYGFVISERFDPHAANIFMIVDIGGGTIDSSIFHVREGNGGRQSFHPFSNFVEFNGVANLHAFRIGWLRRVFEKEGFEAVLRNGFKHMTLPTDFLKAIPESIGDYFKGITISFPEPQQSPDYTFFSARVMQQVLTKTLQTAVDELANPYAFSGMPVFVCGGGSRMSYYKKIEDKLLHHPNATWRSFSPRRLQVPNILEAPGVLKEDYDRLSVAFGLSFMNMGDDVGPPPTGRPVRRQPRCENCGSYTGCYCR